MNHGKSAKKSGWIFASLALSFIVAIPALSAGAPDAFPISHVTRTYQNFTLSPLSCLTAKTQQNTLSALQVAVVAPIFTATPYSQYYNGSFYAFYHKYATYTKPVTTNLNLLNTSLTSGWNWESGWGNSLSLYIFLTSTPAHNCGLVQGKNLHVLSDIDVNNGALFAPSGWRNYDAVLVGFSEYVTTREYAAYEAFVASGGTLIVAGSDSFQVEVGYSAQSNHEWLIGGHGWAFNGTVATPGVQNFFNRTNNDWLGSALCCFHDFVYAGARSNAGNPVGRVLKATFGSVVFKKYQAHEESGITNFTDTSIIATFRNTSGTVVAAYLHQFGLGRVISSSVFLDDIINVDPSAQHFVVQSLVLSLDYANAERPSPWVSN